ncbi:MAG TPA: DciA family protein [Candidatus Polarisedimenticolia bacterium]|nr:DciA family protein [Candidatus Polarisedimenticolia bacterium]
MGREKVVVGWLRRVPKGEAPLLAWPLVCGSPVAGSAHVLFSLPDAVLRVEVRDAGWQREVHSIAFRCLATLKRYGGEKVERIDCVISQGKQE